MTVTVTGEIDVETVPDLRSRIYAEIDANPGKVVVLDLEGMTFIDSTGLGVMVGALKKARLGGGEICINAAAAQCVEGVHRYRPAQALSGLLHVRLTS